MSLLRFERPDRQCGGGPANGRLESGVSPGRGPATTVRSQNLITLTAPAKPGCHHFCWVGIGKEILEFIW